VVREARVAGVAVAGVVAAAEAVAERANPPERRRARITEFQMNRRNPMNGQRRRTCQIRWMVKPWRAKMFANAEGVAAGGGDARARVSPVLRTVSRRMARRAATLQSRRLLGRLRRRVRSPRRVADRAALRVISHRFRFAHARSTVWDAANLAPASARASAAMSD
jgi:hypothetical protein